MLYILHKGYTQFIQPIIYHYCKVIHDSHRHPQSLQEWTSQQIQTVQCSEKLETSASMLNIKVQDSTIRNRLKRYG